MDKWLIFPSSLVLLLAFCMGTLAQSLGWSTFKDDSYGFSMLVPSGIKMIPNSVGGGWTGVHFGVSKDTEVWVHAKQGFFDATPHELRKFAAKVSDIPANFWTPIPVLTGKKINGFTWLESYHAEGNKHFVIALLGVGPKGDFVIFLTSADQEYHANEADFEKWFASIKVY